MDIIRDYSVLFDRFVRRVIDKETARYKFSQYDDYKYLCEYDSRFEAHENSNAIYYDTSIPGNLINRVYFVEDWDTEINNPINGCYRINGMLVYVINFPSKILYEEEVSIIDVAKFLTAYKLSISAYLANDQHLNYANRMHIGTAAAIELFYFIFGANKEIFIKISDDYKIPLPIKEDNKVYENLVRIFNDKVKPISEARIIRAIVDGADNVESNNTIQARFVPGVQKASD